MEKYSFLTSIYKNTIIDEMKVCVESMVNQTAVPDQIVIVIDGQISDDLKEYVYSLQKNKPNLYTIVPLEKNMGLGLALKEGMTFCRNELVARMDTDDICVLDRCSRQLEEFEKDKNLSVCGGHIKEFVGDTNNFVGERIVSIEHEKICEYLKNRCPFNHMTVMFKKSEVERAGGYLDWHYNEDSYLWVRMYLAGCRFYNIDDVLVYARVGKDMYRRRGGYKYFKSEKALFKFMRKNKVIGLCKYNSMVFVRFIVQVLMPNSIRQWFFKNFARKPSKGKFTYPQINYK